MPTPDAAVAIVHTRGTDESVLLIRRSLREDDPWSGHWSFPGGRCEPGDAGPVETALRELAEECGIRLDPGRLERPLTPVAARRRTGRSLLVAPFVFLSGAELDCTLDPREAVAA